MKSRIKAWREEIEEKERGRRGRRGRERFMNPSPVDKQFSH